MKLFRKFIIFSLAIMAFSVVGINAQSYADTPVEKAVQKKILRMTDYGVFDHISFKVNGDTVTLEGKVANARNKKDATAYVEDVPGITRVINNIEILPPSNFDESIRRDLYRSISNYGGLSRYLWTVNPSVRLVVDRGHVSLEGFVANKGDYSSMYIVARGVSGVFSVKNNLVIDNEKAR
jgi:hyperosmotically inducible periplasmic protein